MSWLYTHLLEWNRDVTVQVGEVLLQEPGRGGGGGVGEAWGEGRLVHRASADSGVSAGEVCLVTQL